MGGTPSLPQVPLTTDRVVLVTGGNTGKSMYFSVFHVYKCLMLHDTIELLYTHSLSQEKIPWFFFFDTFSFKITTRLKLVINIDTQVDHEFIYKRKKNPDPKVWNITTA